MEPTAKVIRASVVRLCGLRVRRLVGDVREPCFGYRLVFMIFSLIKMMNVSLDDLYVPSHSPKPARRLVMSDCSIWTGV